MIKIDTVALSKMINALCSSLNIKGIKDRTIQIIIKILYALLLLIRLYISSFSRFDCISFLVLLSDPDHCAIKHNTIILR